MKVYPASACIILTFLMLLVSCHTAPHTTEEKPSENHSNISVTADTPVKKISEYEQVMIDSGLTDIQQLDPEIRVDLKYSTIDNFMKEDVYGELTKCYLRPAAAEKLSRAQTILRKKKPGYNLVVFDGARPRRVQFVMWDVLHIPNKIDYLADPKKGSVHNYGMAVDLSISDDKGNELDMGTPFDYFGVMARPDSEDSLLSAGKLNKSQIENRRLLRTVMTEAGFQPIKTEWWHFTAIPSDEVSKKYRMIE